MFPAYKEIKVLLATNLAGVLDPPLLGHARLRTPGPDEVQRHRLEGRGESLFGQGGFETSVVRQRTEVGEVIAHVLHPAIDLKEPPPD